MIGPQPAEYRLYMLLVVQVALSVNRRLLIVTVFTMVELVSMWTSWCPMGCLPCGALR